MTTLLQDLRIGARMLWKNPGFTLIAVLTLALGIGANTAIFSLINSALIKSLPYPNADRLMNLWEAPASGGRGSISAGVYKDWRAQSRTFSQIALIKELRLNLIGAGEPEHLSGLQVTTEFLSVFGVTPQLGRGFAPGEDLIGGNNRVVILANQYWNQRFGGDPGVIGRTVSLNQLPYTVIGVLPPGALLQDDARFLIPFVVDVNTETVAWVRGYNCCRAVGRLAPGVTPAMAQAELIAIKEQLLSEYPAYKKDMRFSVLPLQQDLTGDLRPTLLILLGTVGMVLLIACANVSNLLLARGNARAREMAIRSALGARPWRIIRQMLAESLLLAVVGCALGLGVAYAGVKLLTSMTTGATGLLPDLMRPELDLRVLGFSIFLSIGCALLFGLLPAFRASKPDLNDVMKETERGGTSVSRRRSQSILVVLEFALTLVLLVGAGLFMRSMIRLLQTDPGFNPKNTLAFDLTFSKSKYPKGEDQHRLISELNRRIAALPGVESVGSATILPLSNRDRGNAVTRPDRPTQGSIGVRDDFVSGDYFTTMGVKLLRGRLITEADNFPTSPRVMMIDATIARDLYPNEDPIGKPIQYMNQTWEVIGVVAPVRHTVLNETPDPRIYGPRTHFSYPTSSIVVRSALPPAALTESVRKTIFAADSEQPIANVRTLEQAVYNSLSTQRSTLTLVGVFASIALLLACIGVYGVMSYAVGQRTRELSVRAALGAQRRDIIWLVLSGGLKLALLGVGLGLVGAIALSRLIEKLLFEVKTHDPVVFISSAVLLILVAVLSIYLPARRASRLDPITALRSE
jgi:predicted permease